MLDVVTVGIFRLSMLEPPGTIGLVSTRYIREKNKSIETFGNGQVSLRMEQWIPSLMLLLLGIRWAVVQHARWGGRRGRSQPHLQVGHHQTPRMRLQFLSDAKMRGRDFFGNTKSYQRSSGVKSSIFWSSSSPSSWWLLSPGTSMWRTLDQPCNTSSCWWKAVNLGPHLMNIAENLVMMMVVMVVMVVMILRDLEDMTLTPFKSRGSGGDHFPKYNHCRPKYSRWTWRPVGFPRWSKQLIPFCWHMLQEVPSGIWFLKTWSSGGRGLLG